MASTLDGAKLKNIQVTGNSLAADLRESCIAASLSLAADKLTELSLDFQDDHTLGVFRTGILSPGTTIVYGDWHMVSDGYSLSANDIGPVVGVKTISRFVDALQRQQGAFNWGNVDVSSWIAAVATSVGMQWVVQPGLGAREVMREAPEDGSRGESTWDVMADLAKQTGTWLFEYGTTLVFARPSWLVSAAWEHRVWPLTWNSWGSYTEGMVGMPEYDLDNSAEVKEKITFQLISADADAARPGDTVELGGTFAGAMAGQWIIKAVDFPLAINGTVKLQCQRAIDPKIQPPKAEKSTSSSGGDGPSSGVASAVDRWVTANDGKAMDFDGAFGAQCVDMVSFYNRDVVGGSNVFGNGKDWYSAAMATGKYTQVSPSSPGQKGDISCYDGTQGGGYGHVAVVLGDAGSALDSFSQNPGPARKMRLSKAGLMGYLRPNAVK